MSLVLSQMSSVKSVHSTQLGAIKFDCLKPGIYLDKPIDQIIDASERDVLKAVLRAGELTSKAEALLRSALRPSDGHVVSDDRSPLGPQSLTINPAGKLSLTGSKAKTPGKLY